MNLFKTYYPQIATILFVVGILLAHFFSTYPYDWMQNTISDLGAQKYSNKIIMQIVFLLFGTTFSVGVLINRFSWKTLPILVYSICVALTGLFCTAPFIRLEKINFSETEALLHSLFAQFAGFSFCVGILTHAILTKSISTKYIHILFLSLVLLLSILFGFAENYQGLFQRVMYLISFIWLIRYYNFK